MGDLASILGVQLREKLAELQKNAPAQGYMQATNYDPRVETVLPDAAFVSRDGRGVLGEGSSRPVETYLPPESGDKVVEGPARPARRTIYLQNQVPVLNESGQQVSTVGPKGAAFLPGAPDATAGAVPIPNAAPNSLENTQAPYMPDRKTKGVFLRHMKDLTAQMLDQLHAQYGMPTT